LKKWLAAKDPATETLGAHAVVAVARRNGVDRRNVRERGEEQQLWRTIAC
jgi:hypothetical protein